MMLRLWKGRKLFYMEILEKLKKINLIQFVPAVFIASLVVNSAISYTAPKTEKMTAAPKSVQAANSTETKKVSIGSLDLSKIKDGTYEGEGNGFRGKVKVAVTVKAHKMTAIKVLSTSDDTAYFNRASSGVIKALLAKQSLDIDVVSGATYSSKGIIAAVKNALTGEEDTSSSAGAGSSSNSAGKVGSTDESGNYKDGTYTGSAQGYHGLVSVSVTIKNNKIKGIKILKNYDDAAYFNRAKGTLIPLMLKKQTTNVDAVSGATYSSNGIIKAVRAALKKASVKKSNSSGSNDSSSNNSKPNSSTSSKPEGVAGTYKDGTYEGSGTGFRGNVKVSVTIKGGVISQIKVVEEKDDAAYFNKARGVIASILKSQNTKVDVVSGATYSSNGIIKAVENALKKALVSGDTSSGDNTNDENADDTTGTEGAVTYTGSATCSPDEDNDFTAYELYLDIEVLDSKITGIKNLKIVVLPEAQWEESLNKDYSKTAFQRISSKLLSGTPVSSVDTVSGATCSSKAILAAYQDAVSKIK